MIDLKLEEKMLGVLLTTSPNQLNGYISKLKREYFTNPIYRGAFEEVVNLNQKGKSVDVLSLMESLKATGKYSVKDLIKVSGTVNISPLSQHEVLPIITGLDVQYKKTTVSNFLINQTRLFNDNRMTLSKFTDDINKLSLSILDNEEDEQTTNDIFIEILKDHENAKKGILPGISVGFENIRKMVLLEPVDVMVIGARPAMGKTAFGLSSAVKMACEEGKTIAFFCIEMSKKQLLRRITSNLTGIQTEKMKFGNCSHKEIEIISSVPSTKGFNKIHIYTGEHTAEEISQKVAELKYSSGVDMFFVDYVQKVRSTLPSSANETDKVKQVSNTLKRITQTLEVPQVQFAQLNKTNAREGKRPTLSDIKQTGDIEQDASIVAFLHRPEYYGEKTMPDDERSSKGLCEFIIAKNREGGLGIKEFEFIPEISKFSSSYTGTVKSQESNEELTGKIPQEEKF